MSDLLLRRGFSVLRFASDDLRSNYAFALHAVTKNPKAFQYVAQELKSDKDFILFAVQHSGLVLGQLPLPWRRDKDIVRAAVEQTKRALRYVDPVCFQDSDIAAEAIRRSNLLRQKQQIALQVYKGRIRILVRNLVDQENICGITVPRRRSMGQTEKHEGKRFTRYAECVWKPFLYHKIWLLEATFGALVESLPTRTIWEFSDIPQDLQSSNELIRLAPILEAYIARWSGECQRELWSMVGRNGNNGWRNKLGAIWTPRLGP